MSERDLGDTIASARLGVDKLLESAKGGSEELEVALAEGVEHAEHSLVARTPLADNHRIEVTVHDTGTGFSTDVVDTLFQPFSTTKPHGMGMGLSISGTIIDAHGGRRWATPGAGGGATFRLALPVTEGVK